MQRLMRKDEFSVMTYLRANEDRFKKERPGFEVLVLEIKKETGITCTAHTIKAICEDAGIVWEQKSGGSGIANFCRNTNERLDRAELTLKELDNQVAENRKLHNRLEQAEQEIQRLRIGLYYLSDRFKEPLPSGVGRPPGERSVTVLNNGPK